MESELERFHKQNTSLELNITKLKLNLKATDKEMHLERQRVNYISNIDHGRMKFSHVVSGKLGNIRGLLTNEPNPYDLPIYQFEGSASVL